MISTLHALRPAMRPLALASLLTVVGSAAVVQAQTIVTKDGVFRTDAPNPAGVSRIGSTDKDLTFTPVTPCRIVDTRVAGGPIAANSSRAFLAVAVTFGANFTSQGGSATNCGVAAINGSAVALNVTAVTPTGAGFTTVYPSGVSRPLAASINYTAGSIVNNTVVVGIPNPLAITDFIIYTFAQSDYVVDIVGYYSMPEATQPACVNVGPASFSLGAGANTYFTGPACPAGYQTMSPYCWGGGVAGVNQTGSGLESNTPTGLAFCAYHNTTGAAANVFVGALCCRVPGR